MDNLIKSKNNQCLIINKNEFNDYFDYWMNKYKNITII
jgi:hypothetical protein